MNNNYDSWFSKWHGWTDGEHTLHVAPFKWDDGKVEFVMRRLGRGEFYKFAVEHVDAINGDKTKALPSYSNEGEVDEAVKGYLYHGRNLFACK